MAVLLGLETNNSRVAYSVFIGFMVNDDGRRRPMMTNMEDRTQGETMQPPQKKTLLQRWKDSIGGWPLLCKIVAWVVLAILAFAAVMCCLWHLTSEPGKCVASIAATSLTIVGGVGAVAYLVIKYQERQQAGRDEERAKREEDREKGRLVNTKMQDAVDQLGSDRASTRIAGVYALTDVADTYGGGYRQRVVDILCGYLRSDRETYPLGADGKPATDQPRSGDSDKAVESTIIAVMRNHLLKERKADNGEIRVRQIVRDDQLWCDCAFDLHGVTFHEYVDLMDITFVRGLNFNRSKFEDHINSKRATFEGYVVFIGTIFKGDANFSRATFKGEVHFNEAIFKGEARFNEAIFKRDAYFSKSTFKGLTDFSGTTFEYATDFRRMVFEGLASFSGAIFKGNADFCRTTFKGNTELIDATFKGCVGFIEATFKGSTYFSGVAFKRDVNFNRAGFCSKTTFSEIQGRPTFRKCKFNRQLRDFILENGTEAYDFGLIPIPEDNDGLPEGAVWVDFPEKDDKDDGATPIDR